MTTWVADNIENGNIEITGTLQNETTGASKKYCNIKNYVKNENIEKVVLVHGSQTQI